MKNRLIFGILACIVLVGCEGYLDTRPSNGFESGEAIRSEEDLAAALRGAYNGLISAQYYGAAFIIYGEVKGDDMQTRIAGQQRSEAAYRFRWLQVDAPEGLWLIPYQVVGRANFVIESIRRGELPETDVLRDARAQALALRALCHFDLLLTYGYPYLKDSGKSLGVPLVGTTLDANALPARSTVDEGYKMILGDLLTALPLAGDNKKDGYFNKWAVEALLARVNLYRGNWDSAWIYAEDVIKHSPYTLIPNDKYASVWAEEYTTESILDLAVSDRSATNKELLGYVASPSGYNSVVATQAFKDLLDEDPADVRLKLLAKKGGFWFINKYPGRKNYIAVNNVRVLRLSDVYLMAAEAALKKKTPDQDKADLYLNAIRLRANPMAANVTATEALILKERRKELVMEGHRFFDAMRLGKTITRKGGFHFLNPTDLISPSWDDHRIIAPIPQAEIDANPNIRGQQNGGY